MAVGNVPFLKSSLMRLIQESDLRLLLNGKIKKLSMKRDNVYNQRVLGDDLTELFWFQLIITNIGTTKLVGLVGIARETISHLS